MTVDFIDRAFLRRMAEPIVVKNSFGEVAAPEAVRCEADPPPALPVSDPVVAHLLTIFPEQWARLAARLAAAFEAGDRVVAVAGRSRGDGCSTIVRGLAHVMQARGMGVTCRLRDTAFASAACRADDCGRVLVDAGVWFPPGPLHRGRLARAVMGCHAALLVRRAGRQPCPAHEQALEALGIHVLGEVVTFADSEPSEAPST